jgi:hypothetical protein
MCAGVWRMAEALVKAPGPHRDQAVALLMALAIAQGRLSSTLRVLLANPPGEGHEPPLPGKSPFGSSR